MVTLHLANLHGDLVADCADTTTATGVTSYNETTEYGAPRTAATADSTYGWLGAKQRSTNTFGGLTLMGVRLYNPVSGKFLSIDPVLGGSANAYDYANQDPVNSSDTSGLYPHMNRYEKSRCKHHPIQCSQWATSAALAERESNKIYPHSPGLQNAYRHLLFSGMLTWYMGSRNAGAWLDDHERGTPNNHDHYVDRYNNSLGMMIGHRDSAWLATSAWRFTKSQAQRYIRLGIADTSGG